MSTVTTTVDLGLREAGLTHGCTGCGGGSHGCGCTDGGGCGCPDGTLERPRWFAGQLVGPADLEALQQWVLARSRRHNRTLHGWGVVCGLAVTRTGSPTGDPVPWSVTVGAGLALSACGDEIGVPGAVRLDIRQPRPSGEDACTPPVDPWCAPVRQRRDPTRTYYLAVRYAEERRRPVRSGSCGCGCDDNPCEYSRIAETVTLAVLDELPDCYDDPGDGDHERDGAARRASAVGCSEELRELGTRPCPDCCSPWVVLADLTVSADGTVEIDPLRHRRFVVAMDGLAFTCGSAVREPPVKHLSEAVRTTLATVFTPAGLEVAQTADAEAILAQPAALLKGARASSAIRETVGDLSVAELARLDTAELLASAAEHGVETTAIERIQEFAKVVTRLASG